MKKIYKIAILLIFVQFALFLPHSVQADPPGMPGDHGGSGDAPPGGGAPIGGGLLILSSIALAYGFGKRKSVDYKIIK